MDQRQYDAVCAKVVGYLQAQTEAEGGGPSDGILMALMMAVALHSAESIRDGMTVEQAKEKFLTLASESYPVAFGMMRPAIMQSAN